MTRIWSVFAVCILVLAGCVSNRDFSQSDIDQLAQAITALDPKVDPQEAQRAALISYSYARQLAEEYGVTDLPIIHNNKVHRGDRERGLCNDYAIDMLRRLQKENFRTLSLHWATSPPTALRIIHHSPVISARGAGFQDGLLLDAWRNGGALFWAPVTEDSRYNWRPRMEVREELLQAERDRQAAQGG